MRTWLSLITIVMAVTLSAGRIEAAQRWSSLSSPSFSHFPQEPRLVGATTTAFAQDADGFLWVGTQDGVGRWDGYRVHMYVADPVRKTSLPDGDVNALFTDRRGRLWVATNGGIVRYDRDHDDFVRYQARVSGLDSLIFSMTDDGRDGLWLATGNGLKHLDPDTGRVQRRTRGLGRNPQDEVRSLLRDRAGTIWAGSQSGLFEMRRGSTAFHGVALVASGVHTPLPVELREDRRGHIWVGTRDNGAFVVDPRTGHARRIVETDVPASTLQREGINGITVAQSGEIWLATYAKGVVVVDPSTLRTHRYRHDVHIPTSLTDDNVWPIFCDRAGLIWIGTALGIDIYNPDQAAFLTLWGGGRRDNAIADNQIPTVTTLADGRIWLGLLNEGIDIIDRSARRITHVRGNGDPTRIALLGSQINAFSPAAAGDVYIATSTGLYRSDTYGGNVEHIRIPQRDPAMPIEAMTREGNRLWIGGDGLWGVALNGHAPPRLIARLTRSALTSLRITTILPDRGTLWIGTDSGLNRYDERTHSVTRINANPLDPRRLANGFITSLLFDRSGHLWVGTAGAGVNLFAHPYAPGVPECRQFGVANGLPNMNVDALISDARGQIWASTDQGLAVIHPRTFTIAAYHRSDGAAITNFWVASAARTAGGELLFGGVGGLTVVRPDRLVSWSYRPPIVVTDLRIGDAVIPPARIGTTASAEPLTIMTDANTLRVEFSALDYSSPLQNRYAYRLDGFDTAWNETDSSFRVAVYTHLGPGSYVLHVRGSNSAGVWTTRELTIPLRVLPAWYDSFWFRLLEVATVVLAVMTLFRLRTTFLRRRQHELEGEVAERTAELLETQRRLETLAYADQLTGLANRRRFADEFRALIARSQRSGARFAVLGVDLDRFKYINDTFGHDAGDAVLVAAAAVMRNLVRSSDCVARLGGDEFVILLADVDDGRAVERLCAGIIARFETDVRLDDVALRTTPSIGVALYPADGATQDDLLKAADLALYEAKHAGRNTWRSYSPLTASVR